MKKINNLKRRLKVTVMALYMALMLPATVMAAADMSFFTDSVNQLQIIVIALGAGLALWGAINLMEGYGGDNPQAKSQGIKQLMAGGGVALLGLKVVPLLAGLLAS